MGLLTLTPSSKPGLSLELFVQQDEYVEGMTEVAGFRVSVHHPSIMPFPEYNGLLVSPGFATDIGLRVVRQSCSSRKIALNMISKT